jgi:two-component system, NtrC family, response regulator PilR
VKKILVVDDEESMREMLGIMLRKDGYAIVTAENRARAAEVLGRGGIDLVVTDIKLPDGDGMEILRHVKAASPETAVVMITAFGSTQMAVAAMKLGAHDYLVKPFDVDEMKMVVRNALEKQDLQEENRRLKAQIHGQHGLDRIIGVSAPMAAIFDLARAVAPTSSTVLISGESGTGKELVAKAIHSLSPRNEAPFVSINCGALPETLLESELFGHVKGAFTDAHQHKRGLFEAAHRGTLFLDEVGVMPAPMQVKLLRALQERKIRRVGGTDEADVDVRVIAATNKPLDLLVREGRFREDLFYRLNVIPIVMPPLRDRRQDIPLLANHFFERFSRDMGKRVEKISDGAMARLMQYDWPGNVRELENIIERAVALETSPAVLPERLPEPIGTLGIGAAESAMPVPVSIGEHFRLTEHIRDLEARLLHRALLQADGDRAVAAHLLGVTGRSLRYLIGKYGEKGTG